MHNPLPTHTNTRIDRYLGPEEALRQMPTLASVRPDGSRLRGAIQYFDGQVRRAEHNGMRRRGGRAGGELKSAGSVVSERACKTLGTVLFCAPLSNPSVSQRHARPHTNAATDTITTAATQSPPQYNRRRNTITAADTTQSPSQRNRHCNAIAAATQSPPPPPQFDDARLNVALATTAAAAGAVVSNYAEVRRLIKNEGGQVIGAVVSDRLGGPPAARRAGSGGSRDASGRSGDSTRASSGSGSGSSADDVEAAAEGDEIEVYAKVVVNATGPFSDALRAMADPAAPPTILASAGAHLTLPAYVGSPTTGMIVPKTKDGRVVFVIPWLDRVIAGTTDEKCDVTDRPAPSEAEVDFILDVLNDFLAVRLGRGDVLSAWSGIRPLAVDPRAADTATASRDHLVLQHEAGGLITITGMRSTTPLLRPPGAVWMRAGGGMMMMMPTPATSTLLLLPFRGGSSCR